MARRLLTPLNFANLTSDPVSAQQGDTYYNTVADKIRMYDGAQWVDVAGNLIEVTETPPANPDVGAAWFDNVNSAFYVYDGSFWVELISVLHIDLENDTSPSLSADLDGNNHNLVDFNSLTLSGDAAVNGGDITTTASTFNLINTNATTLNIGGAATAISVGAATGNSTINNNLVVTGDLTVNGTTTTINTQNLNVEDNIITLNYGVTGSPTLNAGVEIERGTSANVAIRWNETDDQWEYTNDGSQYSAIGSGGGAISTNLALSNSWWLGV